MWKIESPRRNLQVIIAFTSGTGKFISSDYVFHSVHNLLHGSGVKKIKFCGFNKCEATVYLKSSLSPFALKKWLNSLDTIHLAVNVTGFWKTDHTVTHEINRISCLCICNFNEYIFLNFFQCLNSNSSCV